MKILEFIFTKLIPTKDTRILELRREIKRLKKENRALKEKIFVLEGNKKIVVKFYDEDIEKVIIENLRKAKNEICISMAWFTSEKIINELEYLKNKGVNIKIIISDNKCNSKVIKTNPCDVLKVVAMPSKNERKSNMMHNKYCIIDNKQVIDGSYNWSNNAKYNLEHIIIIEDVDVAGMYKKNFNKIFSNSRYYANYTVYENENIININELR